MVSAKKKSRPPKRAPRSPRRSANPLPAQAASYQKEAVALLVLGWVLITAGVFSLPNFHLFLAPGSPLARLLTLPWLLVLGVFCLGAAYFLLPEEGKPENLPRSLAYPWFLFLFALCFFWRFYRPLQPSAPFWFDNQVVTADIVAILDAHLNHLLFPWGEREPGFPYLTAFLWKLMPWAGGVWIVRLSCTVIDLFALWGMYLLGSSIRGRRMGLILMALWAVSLPMTIWNYFGMGQNTAALAAVWTLVFFYRLIQRPSWPRFLYWGAALGMGGYCYVPFRPWTPAMITLVLFWMLFLQGERPKGRAAWVLAGGLWGSWVFLFLYKNNFIHVERPWVGWVVRPEFLAFLALFLAGSLFLTWKDGSRAEGDRRIFGWALGSLATALLMAPLYLHPLYSAHTSESSALHQAGKFAPGNEGFHMLWNNVVFFFSAMFGQTSEDVSRYPIGGSSYFEVFPEWCMFLGSAYFLARPSWPKAMVVVMALVGSTSFILSFHPHTGRVESAVPPLLLLGAWGLDHFWTVVSTRIRDPWNRRAVVFLVAALAVWDAQRTFTVCRDWMAFKSNDARIGEQLDLDWRKYRVILSVHYPEFATPALTVLCDQKEAYTLNDPNPIFLEQGQKQKDIAFYMYGSTRFDKPLEDRVRAEFPQAQWSVVECPNKDVPRFMLRAIIPMDSLAEAPGKLFYIQRVPHDFWRRRFYWKDYGVARGMVWWDDRVGSWSAPMPRELNEYMSARIEGEIQVPAEGEYEFRLKPTLDVSVLEVDGDEVFSLKPQSAPLEGLGKVHLKQGTHRVSYVTTFRRNFSLPEIQVTGGGVPGWVLGRPAQTAGR